MATVCLAKAPIYNFISIEEVPGISIAKYKTIKRPSLFDIQP